MFKQIHEKGLKFGIYADYGKKTCEGYPGTLEINMATDAKTFVEWGVDFIKLDGCFTDPLDMELGFINFGYWMWKMGRPMVYACSWPIYQNYMGISVN